MHIITVAQLRQALQSSPSKVSELWVAPLNEAMLLYGIADDVDYMCHFLTQCAHESVKFTRLEERLGYSAERLMDVWPKRFPTLQVAVKYAQRPHDLADYVYANRMGNGDVSSGDGWKYRGRGLLMVTGRSNYALVSRLLNDKTLMDCPDKLCTPTVAAMASAAWWAHNPRLNTLADDLPDDDDAADLVSISRIVNGGNVGLHGRQILFRAFHEALTGG